jgi:hypothetical protein
MQVFKDGNTGVGDSVIKVVSHSKNTPRYDDVFFSSYNTCINPKHLFSAFSNVAEEAEEYVPISPLTSQKFASTETLHLVYGPNLPSVGGAALQPTSIMPGLHGARAPGHAATGGPAGGMHLPGQLLAASPGPGTPPVHGPGAPSGGGTVAARLVVHGNDSPMHTPVVTRTTTMITTSVQSKVKNAPYFYLDTNMYDLKFEQTNNAL